MRQYAYWVMRAWLGLWVGLVVTSGVVRAGERVVVPQDQPLGFYQFELSLDGQRIYASQGRDFVVLDLQGQLLRRIPAGHPSAPRKIFELPDGRFVALLHHAAGHLALYRADGSEISRIVQRSERVETLRADGTGWTSPNTGTLDVKRGLIYVADTTMAPRDDRKLPDPDWSRIAVFDLEGKFVRDMRRYSAYEASAAENDGLRTWYEDMDLDVERNVLYVTTRRERKLLALDEQGKQLAQAASPGGALAVLPDGRVVTAGTNELMVYAPLLAGEPQRISLNDLLGDGTRLDVRVEDLDSDGQGRLFATLMDGTVNFVKWDAALSKAELIRPRFSRLEVAMPELAVEAGQVLKMKYRLLGNPVPAEPERWRVMMRPSDGSELSWRDLPVHQGEGALEVELPVDLVGAYELVVRPGAGPIDWARRSEDIYVQQRVVVRPMGSMQSMSVLSSSGRKAFVAGEAIDVQIITRRAEGQTPVETLVVLSDARERVLLEQTLPAEHAVHWRLPAALTSRLPQGNYKLQAMGEGYVSYPLVFDVAAAQVDSPMQRIVYQEFANNPMSRPQPGYADDAERYAGLQAYLRALVAQGFTRETDRQAAHHDKANPAVTLRPGLSQAQLTNQGFADASWYPWYAGHTFHTDQYLDQMVRYGLRYDSQLLGHCDGVKIREPHFEVLVPHLQRLTQWWSKYPSFYGFNYNDEMFFGGWAAGWVPADVQWLEDTKREFYPDDKSNFRVYVRALRLMYDTFNQAVRQAHSGVRITTTPMWQYPAVEGSYAPVIYEGMDESYSHYLSEGYHKPWYPSHSAEFLRRPGLPMMGVFDNHYNYGGRDGYLQDLMQVVARGVQGVGTQHKLAFDDPWSSDAYRVGNWMARNYGPVFAELEPLNEALLLYSSTQDVTEHRNTFGTPHWERVFETFGAGLMAGVPMAITYESDVAKGYLMKGKKPRVPMLILVGQKVALPDAVSEAIVAYVEAGGKVLACADSTWLPEGVVRQVDVKTHRTGAALGATYAADTAYPVLAPIMEELAKDWKAALAEHRQWKVDSDNPWVAVNRFDGGSVKYVVLSTDETAPLPWEAGAVWAMGELYRSNVRPQRATVSLPRMRGTVYDVLNREQVKVQRVGESSVIEADLTLLPGQVLAISEKEIGLPELKTGLSAEGELHLRVQMRDEGRKDLSAAIPLRVRLLSGQAVLLEKFRGSNLSGQYEDMLALPSEGGSVTVEVTELIAGHTVLATLNAPPLARVQLVERPAVEVLSEARLRRVLEQAQQQGSLTLSSPAEVLNAEQIEQLRAAMQSRGVKLVTDQALPEQSRAGVYLTVGNAQSWGWLPVLQQRMIGGGLLPSLITGTEPGQGRGLIAAALSVRGRGEHAIALIGGDAAGVQASVEAWVDWLKQMDEVTKPPGVMRAAVELKQTGKKGELRDLPTLREQLGIRLGQIKVDPRSGRVLVAAEGYENNLALVEDADSKANVLRVARVGQGPEVAHLMIASGGNQFAASARLADRIGQAWFVFASGKDKPTLFTPLLDVGRQFHQFAMSSDGQYVVVPGMGGVVAWQKQGEGWREMWAMDDWKNHAKLDWPVSDKAERTPRFDVHIARDSDEVVVMFSELSNNGWVTPDNHGKAHLAGYDLAQGNQRWKWEVPIKDQLLLPRLYTSPDGSRMLVHVQVGSWHQQEHQLFVLHQGKQLAHWVTGDQAPWAVAVADGSGAVALAYNNRLLEVRRADGSLLVSRLWDSMVLSLAFSHDGQSLYVSDQAGLLTQLDARGIQQWQQRLGSVSHLAVQTDRIYAAGWDGRLRSFTHQGQPRWTLDLTQALRNPNRDDPMAVVKQLDDLSQFTVVSPVRKSTVASVVPEGENMLRTGQAKLTLGGTGGWMSNGVLEVKADDLVDGDATTPAQLWLNPDELYWNSHAGRQVWAEINFTEPTRVNSLTVHEHAQHPQNWTDRAVIQQWNEQAQRWDTVAAGTFMKQAVMTYTLNLDGVKRLRYVPMSDYYRNFRTTEIEVR